MKYVFGIAAATLLLSPVPATSATLIVNGSGQLSGANDVDIGGTLYDVRFEDGSCAGVFSGCDDAGDFDFDNAVGLIAAQALVDQVFLDSAQGLFDSRPDLTSGCGHPNLCYTYIPTSSGKGVYAGNRAVAGGDDIGELDFDPLFDHGQDSQVVWARFSIVQAAVPEPLSWSMMIGGFGMIGAVSRRRNLKLTFT